MLIVLFVSLLKVPLTMLRMSSCAEGAKIFAILFENSLVLRTSQQSLVKWAWAFRQLMAAPTVSHSEA